MDLPHTQLTVHIVCKGFVLLTLKRKLQALSCALFSTVSENGNVGCAVKNRKGGGIMPFTDRESPQGG